MPSIRYYNQTAPFWDWVASMENAAGEHPFFHAYASQGGEARDAPGSQGHPPPPETNGPPPPPEYDGSAPPPPPPGSHPPPHHQHEGPPGTNWGRHGGRCGGRGGWGGRGRHGAFPFGGPAHHDGGWGGFGGHGRRGGRGPFDMNALSQFLSQRFGFDVTDETEGKASYKANNDKDFSPPCDVFDTPDAYVLHLSLPGAKKEDVGVNWDADKSEVNVAGVIYRIGDEEMLKTLAMDEREVGVFEKKVRLGSRANPASVDSDAITAKMEDGVLIVRVPKVEEFVEIKKVDIE